MRKNRGLSNGNTYTDPAFRAQLLSEQGEPTGSDLQLIADLMESAFSMQYVARVVLEPSAEQSIEQRAIASGVLRLSTHTTYDA